MDNRNGLKKQLLGVLPQTETFREIVHSTLWNPQCNIRERSMKEQRRSTNHEGVAGRLREKSVPEGCIATGENYVHGLQAAQQGKGREGEGEEGGWGKGGGE